MINEENSKEIQLLVDLTDIISNFSQFSKENQHNTHVIKPLFSIFYNELKITLVSERLDDANI